MPIYRLPVPVKLEVKANIERLGQVERAKRGRDLVTRSLIRWPGRTISDIRAQQAGFILSNQLPGSVPGRRPQMTARTPDAEPLLTPAEVATMFRVDPKTVTRWAKAGKLTSIRTLGGHRRYREAEVRALLQGIPSQQQRGQE